ncbi:MAG TPA: GNAT family N-acetyltransferase [Acidimicrobiales bacterium]|nr:GNAT family N-acetyltransferase [Acidimicrobiales bacterium]
MASYEIRVLEDDEFGQMPGVFGTAFGFQPSEETIADWKATTEMDRTLAAFDGDVAVGTAAAHSFELTVPGAQQVAAAGVTAVAVRTTHKRRKILTSLMKRQLTDVADRGEPLAILLASESVIYGRFGYGLSTSHLALELNPRHGDFARPVDDSGRFRQLDKDGAKKVFPGLFDASRKRNPGDIDRSAAWWDIYFKDREHERQGASALFCVVHESAKGKADGYFTYRVKGEWQHGLPNNEIRVQDLVADNPTVYAAMWQYALDIDLAGAVTAWGRPVDEPLRWLLADPRRLRTTVSGDFLWTRIIDVPAALAARRYATDGSVVLEVVDDFIGSANGRFALSASPGDASCAPTKKKADITLTVADLGAVYLGGHSFGALARVGRIEENAKGALARADAMFAVHPAPYCRTGF